MAGDCLLHAVELDQHHALIHTRLVNFHRLTERQKAPAVI